jgi:hypothetical protein
LKDIKGFPKGMAGMRASTEEELVRDKEENMFYFTRKSPECPVDCMTTRYVRFFFVSRHYQQRATAPDVDRQTLRRDLERA